MPIDRVAGFQLLLPIRAENVIQGFECGQDIPIVPGKRMAKKNPQMDSKAPIY